MARVRCPRSDEEAARPVGKKQYRQSILKYELTGIIMFFLSALALGQLGTVGRLLDVAFIYLAGSWSFLVPVFVMYSALYVMIQRGPFMWHGRHMGLLVLMLTWLTGMELYFYLSVSPLYPPGHVELWGATIQAVEHMRNDIMTGTLPAPTRTSAGGGLIGYATFSLAHYLFGLKGSMFALGVGTLIGGALVTQRSLVAGVQRGTRWMERWLDGVWRGCRQYVALLFGPDRPMTATASASGATVADEVEEPVRRKRRKPALIVDGEVVSEEEAPRTSVDEPPIVHDFAAKLRDKHQQEVTTPVVEQVGNQMVARFPDKKKPAREAEEKAPLAPYEVGAMVRDENYELPPLRIFSLPNAPRGGFTSKHAQDNARKLELTLESFGVQAKVLEISRGPAVTRYELQPATGVKVSRIVNLTDDIALALAARDIRMEAPVPGKSVIGIEVPNVEVSVVTLREVLESPDFQEETGKLAIALGRDISGAGIVGNLQKMPHLLVAGATGSGKSVCINGIIASILMKAKPHEVKLLMIDPKMVELSGYNGIPHLLAPVVTDPRKAAMALNKVVQEMDKRYQLFSERGARDIERYNQLMASDGLDTLPFIVVIIDELADLMMVAPGDVEDYICRIAQKARACGIHLIVATQRPSVDVITGLIKANIPSRIAFAVSSMADSRTILDAGGAEKLLGRGDMLYFPAGASKPTRVQGVYVSDQEIEQLVDYVKHQQSAVYTVDLNHADESHSNAVDRDLDGLFVDAVDLVVESGQASVSMVQRRFRVGYSRAARIIDQMEQQGLVGPFEGSKPREVLVTAEQWEQMRSSFQTGN